MSLRCDTSLWYGETGAGKTAQIGEIARWEFGRTGRITRLISADSGWDPIEDLIAIGVIEAWNIQYLRKPWGVLADLSDGDWPQVRDGKLIMVKPKFRDGALVSGDKLVGQYAIEGLSTISDMLMQDHIRNQRKVAMDVVGGFSETVDEDSGAGLETRTLKFGKAAPAHYGQVQDFVLLDLVPRFAMLPVSRVLWTAHEAKGDDDITGMKNSVLGPATIGKAAVSKSAKKFGDTFHFAKLMSAARPGAPPVLERRAYYEDHPDDVLNKLLWPAKLSLPLSRVADLRKRFPGSYVPLTLDQGMTAWMEFKYGHGDNSSGDPELT